MADAVAEFRAQIAAASAPADPLITDDPTAFSGELNKEQRIDALKLRRKRFTDEASLVLARAEGERRAELNATEALFVRRLLAHVAAIDEALPPLEEQADADRQHAETMRNYGFSAGTFVDCD